ncbi:MAG: ferritin-like domain-containing protein [Deltaproteobacteria bacterium]|nr:ferritin-like domain-containing protein [Deltaproteobacteria bacterium]
MTGREFVESLWSRYHDELEGPVIAIRKALAELDPQSPEFVGLMQRQAKKELAHAVAFTKALLQYGELEPHERASVAEQAADEYKHYALIKDYLTGRGAADDIPAEAYDGYFGQFLTGDVRAFRLCNIAEKSAVVFMEHMRDVTPDPVVRQLAKDIVDDEEGHEDMVMEKLARFAEDPGNREFLENMFVQSWTSQKEGVIREGRELGIDVDAILDRFKARVSGRAG